MGLAQRLPGSIPELILGKSKGLRRARVISDPRAQAAMSRETRWKRRNRSAAPAMALCAVAALALVGGAYAARDMIWSPASQADAPLVLPEFVMQVNALFPEALPGATRVVERPLNDGRPVASVMTMLVPSHVLDSPAASNNAFERLSAEFVGAEQTISGPEMGRRMERLVAMALPADVTRCYTYAIGEARRITSTTGKTLRVRPLEIDLNPEC